MAKSAASSADERRLQRQLQVQRSACELVLAHGYDGFTMDDLAEAVGVSRRTLFNIVADKESSVLGPMDDDKDKAPLIAEFIRKPASDNPARDVLDFVGTVFQHVDTHDLESLGDHALVERAAAMDPKVRQLIRDRFATLTEGVTELICERQGWPEQDLRGRVLAQVVLSLIQVALSEHGLGSGADSLAATYDRVIEAARDTGLAL